MTYELSWQVYGEVLLLSISGNYTLEDAKEADILINQKLNDSQGNLSLFIDAMNMDRPLNFQQIRESQTYMDHQRLARIFVVASDKLIKLSMMVIFHLARAQFRVFDDVSKAQSFYGKFNVTDK